MGLVFATTVIVCLVAAVKRLKALARRIEEGLVAREGSGGPPGAAGARIENRATGTVRYSEWQVRRQGRVLVEEVEVFLAGRTC